MNQTQLQKLIENRNWEVSWMDSYKHKHEVELYEKKTIKKRTFYLMHGEGWYHYSNRFGARYRQFSYLIGSDDSGRFVRRIKGNIKTVDEALSWLIPSAVLKAIANKKRVERQGDVYLVEQSWGHDNLSALPDGHIWSGEVGRAIYHNGGHASSYWPQTGVKAYRQKELAFGRRNHD